MSELLPCPFCGKPGGVISHLAGPEPLWQTCCDSDDCPQAFDYATRAEAVAAWNARPLPPAVAELVKRATEAAEALEHLPADCLGEGREPVASPDGEADVLVWSIRDELVHHLRAALSAVEGAALAAPADEVGR